jgi:cardiolipin synthase A/B
MLEDIAAATSSVHINQFGFRPGVVGERFAQVLLAKAAEGVPVRLVVDRQGSDPEGGSQELYERLTAAGIDVCVVRATKPRVVKGALGAGGGMHWNLRALGHIDHRKLAVIDGRVGWVGGAGIEDHFEDGRFHDVMVRVTGDVVRQAQAAFLTSFRGHGGRMPADLSPYFPEPADAGSTPVALAQVIPGGFVAASQAIREQIDAARSRLDVMNPYITDSDMIERIVAAGRRGVRVRLVVAETSNNAQATAALEYRYPDLIDAGVEVWELPGTVVHAKVVVADDTVSFGTVNLDSWALYRNSEIAMIARSPETAALLEERLFAPDIARSKRGEPRSEMRERFESWLWDKLTFFL